MKRIFLFIIIFTSISFAQTVVDSYPESNYAGSMWTVYKPAESGIGYVGQSFTGNGSTLSSVKFYLNRGTGYTDSCHAYLYAHSGTYGTSSVPTGSPLATAALPQASLPVSFGLVTFTFSSSYTLQNSTYYVIVYSYTGGGGEYYSECGRDATSPTHSGNSCYSETGSSWTAISSQDLIFYVYSPSISTFVPIITID